MQEFEKIKAGRFQEVADKLYAEMKHNKEAGIQYNFDWFMRFYEIVGNISDEKSKTYGLK